MKHLFLSGLLLASTGISLFPNAMNDQQEHVKKPQWQEFLKDHVTSITAGAILGSFTGYLSAKVYLPLPKMVKNPSPDKISESLMTIIWNLVIFGIERGLRYDLVDAMHENFNKYSIKHHHKLLDRSAWLASWMAFLSSLTFSNH